MHDYQHLDQTDPLAAKRDEFIIPEGLIYLDGNSLGPLTLSSQQRAQAVVTNQWGDDLIQSWNSHQWIDLPYIVGNKIAQLIGAKSGQVICCDSISVNLFKVLAAALQLHPNRSRILTQHDNFPTDNYIAQGLESLLGREHCEICYAEDTEIERSLDESIAVLCLTQVNFRSGHRHNIQRLTQAAHDQGIIVVWDLAHSVGVIPLSLDEWQVDFALGCGYKYLNGGPGAPAFIYAAEAHHQQMSQPITGWMGHRAAFDFSPDYVARSDIGQFLSGTPPILSMSVLDAALELFTDIDIEAVFDKAIHLADYFAEQVSKYPSLRTLERITPTDTAIRGAQLSYRHPDAYAICQALIADQVVTDFRAPDILRFGFSPLYLRYSEIYHAVSVLDRVLTEGTHQASEFQQKNKVT